MENVAAILQQLSGNPSNTPIGQLIDLATDPNLESEDWNLNMQICDMINDTANGPKDAVRAIKRRLFLNAGKNHKAVLYTLTVLETCVKNCGRRFHLLITSKDFVQELIKLIGPKNEPPPILQERVLRIIETWADAFRGQADLSGVVQAYYDLKIKGIDFPKPNQNSMVPIHTPQRTNINPIPSNQSSQNQRSLGNNSNLYSNNPSNLFLNQHTSSQINQMTGPVVLNDEQLSKLKLELETVDGNIKIFDEMLNEINQSNSLSNEDLELLNELYLTCQQIQKRIVELIDKVSNEKITEILLIKNDTLNTLFSKYEANAQQKKSSLDKPKFETIPIKPNVVTTTNTEEKSLIDLEDSKDKNSLEEDLQNLNLGAVGGQPSKEVKMNETSVKQSSKLNLSDSDFDAFAQLRSEKKINSDIEIPNEQEVDEMERWLEEQTASGQSTSLSNTEFDKFLAERANNLEKQPNISPKPNDKKDSNDLLDF